MFFFNSDSSVGEWPGSRGSVCRFSPSSCAAQLVSIVRGFEVQDDVQNERFGLGNGGHGEHLLKIFLEFSYQNVRVIITHIKE